MVAKGRGEQRAPGVRIPATQLFRKPPFLRQPGVEQRADLIVPAATRQTWKWRVEALLDQLRNLVLEAFGKLAEVVHGQQEYQYLPCRCVIQTQPARKLAQEAGLAVDVGLPARGYIKAVEDQGMVRPHAAPPSRLAPVAHPRSSAHARFPKAVEPPYPRGKH